MAGKEALLMSSLVLILAVFLRKRRTFVRKNCWLARNAGIDSACRRCETGKDLDEGSERPTGPEEL